MKLDRKFLASIAAPTDKAEITYWDDVSPGLGLRVLRSGAQSWIVRYRIGKRQKFTTIARAADLKLNRAQEIAATFRAKAKLGQDAGGEVAALKAQAENTLGQLVAAYLSRHVERRQKPRTQIETKRHLLAYWKLLHKVPVAAVDRRRVARELQRIAQENGDVAANRGRSSLSAMFAWAIREGLAEVNPVIGTNKMAEERSRERVLADDELRAIWAATAGGGAYERITRLLLLTGLRRDEVGALAWTEVDLAGATLTLPAARTKNGRPHAVPLVPEVRIALAAVAAEDDAGCGGKERTLVFSAAVAGFSGWSRSKERLDGRIARARRDVARPDRAGKPLTAQEREAHALARWTLHDCRRTVATRLADLGAEPHVIEEILGHSGGHKAGVHGVYNRATYEPQKRAALTLWTERLTEIAEGRPAAVVPMRAAR